METQPATGYARVNGVRMYWESRGTGATPLVLVHGGFGLTSTFGGLLESFARQRQVIAVELQGHGHTADIDRPFRYEDFGDDLAAFVEHLGLGPVDLLGYSLGGGARLRCAVQHPDRLRRLVLVSTPFRRDAWFPEVRAAFDQMGSAGFETLRQSPMYAAWLEVAPDKESFPRLMDKTGELQRRPYDWSDDLRGLSVPTLVVCADSDSFAPSHAAELFSLLGGGQRDAGWDGALPTEMRLAITPGRTHYNILEAPLLEWAVADFLA